MSRKAMMSRPDALPALFWIVMKRYHGWEALPVVKETEHTITVRTPGWEKGSFSYDRKNKPPENRAVRLTCETTAKELAEKLEGIRVACDVEIGLLIDERDEKITKIIEEANQ